MAREGENPLARPVELAGLVDYAPGSVVSRTVLKKSTGTLTLFAFAEGEGLSEHSSPHDAVLQVLDGRVDVKVAGDAHMVESGQALLLPANVPHALNASERFKMLLIMIREPQGR